MAAYKGVQRYSIAARVFSRVSRHGERSRAKGTFYIMRERASEPRPASTWACTAPYIYIYTCEQLVLYICRVQNRYSGFGDFSLQRVFVSLILLNGYFCFNEEDGFLVYI